jgi:hypothetical protein
MQSQITKLKKKKYHYNYKFRRTSENMGTTWCPKCGEKGSLKRRFAIIINGISPTGSIFYEVDHYLGPGHKKYDHCCYLGVQIEK